MITVEESSKHKHVSMSKEMFDKFNEQEKSNYLLSRCDTLEDVVMEWGQKFAQMQDGNNAQLAKIVENHGETVSTLKSISDTLAEFTRVVFGDKRMQYSGVVQRQALLEEKLGGLQKEIFDKVYGIKKEQDAKIEKLEKEHESKIELIEKELHDKIELIAQQAKDIGVRVKWTTRIVWTSIAGSVIFIGWATDKCLEIYQILQSVYHK